MERLGLGDGLGQLTARPVIIALLMLGENLGWAFGSNLAVLPLAALGLVNPMLAGAAMARSSVSVVGNSLRLRRFARGRPRTRHRRSKPGTTSAPSDQRDGQ